MANDYHIFFSSQTDEWATPQAIFDELDKEFHFTLDPACTIGNAKCKKFYTKAEDGLQQSWGGNQYSATHLMEKESTNGYARRGKNHASRIRLWLC